MDGLDPREPSPLINYSKWVDYVFVELYKKGLIYRGRRMVNWCVVSHTALSDEEVNMKEIKGHLWYIHYPLAQSELLTLKSQIPKIIVATTRPETMLGDTAVAVHPQDERYKGLIGKKVKLPLIAREIPIIADEAVDPKFGTGCVKVTPAHDPADFEIGLRHQLAQIQVIGFDGKMTREAGENYQKMDRYECRKQVIANLEKLGFIEKVENYTHNVGYSERADVPIEPMISEQWFLKYPAVQSSIEAILKGKIKFWPEHWAKVYEHWMQNIKDWCISRQLWWGHQIPVWTRKQDDQSIETYVGIEPPQGEGWQQDPDVLDTWFSSWLWPFATMIKDPDHLKSEIKSPHSLFSKFYPTMDLVTAPEILFFWVARMIMAGFEFIGEKPFSHVYLNGIVRDKVGRKMSKTLGNSPDPLDLIKKYSADALRFGTMRCAPIGLDVRFDEQQVELGRNFCNKLWNAARLRLSQPTSLKDKKIIFENLHANDLTSDDQTILMRLDDALLQIDKAFNRYEFHQVTGLLYELFWTHYCDWYLESSKAILYGSEEKSKAITLAVMDRVLNSLLRLLHPFMPFITEEISQQISIKKSVPLIISPWPVS